MPRRPRLDPASAKIRKAVEDALEPGHTYLIAVSGGADSMSLAAACAFLARKDYQFVAVTVDHGLQEGSAEVAARTQRALTDLGLTATVQTAEVTETSDGLEADARTARYAALDKAAKENGTSGILLAHTQNDQAETVLLGLLRGSGARSLAGMRPRTGRYIRPLLGITRAETESATTAQNIPVWNDPMNFDSSFTRVKVRTQLMPALAEVAGPGVYANLARTAHLLAMDSDELEAQTDAQAHIRGDTLLRTAAELPAALRTRVIRDWLWQFSPTNEAGFHHVTAIDDLLTGARAGAVSCPPAAEVVRTRSGDVQFRRRDGQAPIYR